MTKTIPDCSMEVFSAFKGLPEGSTNAYKYHKRGFKQSRIGWFLFVFMLGHLSYQYIVHCYLLANPVNLGVKYVTTLLHLIALIWWIWFLKDTFERNKKHRTAMDEVINGTHKECFNYNWECLQLSFPFLSVHDMGA